MVMTQALWAQVIGAIGFTLLIIAPLTHSRRSFLILDIIGIVPVGVHYLMLDAPLGAALCATYVAMDIVATSLHRSQNARAAYYLFYPAALALSYWTYQTAIDLTALAGTLLAVASRQQLNLVALKMLVFLSAFGWGAYGLLTGSMAQLVFSSLYGGAALIATIRHRRRANPAASPDPE